MIEYNTYKHVYPEYNTHEYNTYEEEEEEQQQRHGEEEEEEEAMLEYVYSLESEPVMDEEQSATAQLVQGVTPNDIIRRNIMKINSLK